MCPFPLPPTDPIQSVPQPNPSLSHKSMASPVSVGHSYVHTRSLVDYHPPTNPPTLFL